jgi:hypothetical protein
VQKRFEKKDFIQIKQEFDALMVKINQRTQQQSLLITSVIDNQLIADTMSDDIK